MDLPVQIREDGSEFILIHYLYRQIGIGRAKTWIIACVPHRSPPEVAAVDVQHWHRTTEPFAVTCPSCQRTPEYQAALEELKNALAARRATV